MIRVDKIFIKKHTESATTLVKLQQLIKNKLLEVASATKHRVTQDGMQIEVNLGNPISLQTVNKIFKMFDDEGIKVKEFSWKPMKVGIFKLGILEVTVS